MKKLIAFTLSAAFLAGIAQAEPATRTSTFDGPKASGTKTTVRNKDAGTFSSDKIVTRKSDGATATSERDRQRTDTGFTSSGSRTGFNGKTWLDMRGLPATEEIKVTERFTRPTIGRLKIDVTIDDPKAYTKPWDVKLAWRLVPDTDLIESICEENNRDLPHMVGK